MQFAILTGAFWVSGIECFIIFPWSRRAVLTGNTYFGKAKLIAWQLKCSNREIADRIKQFLHLLRMSRYMHNSYIEMTLYQILPGGWLDKYHLAPGLFWPSDWAHWWQSLLWPDDWENECLVLGGYLPRQYLLCRAKFIAWWLSHSNMWNVDGIKHFLHLPYMSLDSCMTLHVKMTLCEILTCRWFD